MTTTNNRIWFITGGSKGLGHAFTLAALEAGDKVAAVARNIGSLEALKESYPDSLLPITLDITNRESVFAAVKAAKEHFGRLDVIVNNAGTMTLGMVEELSEADARSVMETNFFGALWVSQAAMPYLREQGSGHLIQISSIGALVAGPMTGIYSASKFALEGLSEALAKEAAAFGINLTMVEPGGYWTDMYLTMRLSDSIEAYGSLKEEMGKQSEGSVDSDPRLAAEALMKLVESENPPSRLILGSMVFDAAMSAHEERIAVWKQWESVSRAAEKGIPAPEGYGLAAE
ncbi:SDR family oxidoreductase [Cohnella thailandensis]|uniref:SDR family oxidoreductase n=1 Tax=Cohnella thailandensis TaxID=557557 RepID=A0A841T006_9BACL|nr:SDR family oxidoreductase [Cohnella thailandensis]MBB6637484.1 SDR family oxidoreductase [Cohnella thailandensis]MBP1977517.1 NAD(P)-dependent dehydrogenase (short-subunit alcohol dehydrogenase family) [Cohnella thailandensis]